MGEFKTTTDGSPIAPRPFGRMLRELREFHALPVEALATRSGLPAADIRAIETEDDEPKDPLAIMEVFIALGVPFDMPMENGEYVSLHRFREAYVHMLPMALTMHLRSVNEARNRAVWRLRQATQGQPAH